MSSGERKEAQDREAKKDLTKQDILEVLQAEPMKSLIARSGTATIYHICRGVGFFLLLCAGLYGYTLQWKSNFISQQIQQIEKTIEKKEQMEKNIKKADFYMRKINNKLRIKCKHNITIPQAEQELERDNGRYKFAESITGSYRLYGDVISKKLLAIMRMDDSAYDICAKNAPTDSSYEEAIANVTKLMGKSQDEDLKKIKELENQRPNLKLW